MKREQHITPHPKGGYQVKAAGATRATKRFATQKEAIAEGRRIAKSQKTELVIHNGKKIPTDMIHFHHEVEQSYTTRSGYESVSF